MIEILVTIVGVLMSFGYYPQAYKIYKNKSSRDISLSTYVILAFGTLTWFLYGLYLHNPTITFSFLWGVIGSWGVLGLTLYYRTKKNT